MSDVNDYEFIDKENMHQEIKNFSMMVSQGFDIEAPLTVDMIPKSILICGMGGSGIPGDLLKNYIDTKATIDVIKNYHVPHYVNEESLVFVLSYSGNTEETIECYREASKRKAKVIVITTGGKLETVAKLKGDDVIKVPEGHQPRAALPFLFFAMLKTLVANKIVGDKSSDVKKVLESLGQNWYEENAKKLAMKLKDKLPIVYGSNMLSSAVLRWKTQINENAKTHCFTDLFSEVNHNEICGYTNLTTNYHVVMLMDEEDSAKIKKRMDITKELITSDGCEVTQIKIKGDNKLAKIFSAIYLGDWVSFYLAVLYDVDPTPVKIIEDLKKRIV